MKPILKVLKPLEVVPCQVYANNIVQVPDLLELALDYTGPAIVTITSFSISEEFLRRLFFLRKKGNIKELRIVLDFKATNKTLLLWPFIRQTVENCYLADNHSKALLVEGEERQVCAVLSQNLTRGNRFECGAVFTGKDEFSSLKSQIDHIIKNLSVPFSDVYRTAVETD